MELRVLLLKFFKLFGKTFDYDYYGISIHHGFFLKSHSFLEDSLLMVEDPNKPDVNLGSKSFLFHEVVQLWSDAYDILNQGLPLSDVVQLDEKLVERKREIDEYIKEKKKKRNTNKKKLHAQPRSIKEILQSIVATNTPENKKNNTVDASNQDTPKETIIIKDTNTIQETKQNNLASSNNNAQIDENNNNELLNPIQTSHESALSNSTSPNNKKRKSTDTTESPTTLKRPRTNRHKNTSVN
eukprot:TRINITY_DN8433_c0_g1_i2.p1 TRINITY_DN8433_c0_g1~~TRINITY_DN8433_c0_g1_i2.p1  ORF type:complete len:241 (+),score=46.20 TRINITY_DN8433_c0_g1_i2:115-837(+)